VESHKSHLLVPLSNKCPPRHITNHSRTTDHEPKSQFLDNWERTNLNLSSSARSHSTLGCSDFRFRSAREVVLQMRSLHNLMRNENGCQVQAMFGFCNFVAGPSFFIVCYYNNRSEEMLFGYSQLTATSIVDRAFEALHWHLALSKSQIIIEARSQIISHTSTQQYKRGGLIGSMVFRRSIFLQFQASSRYYLVPTKHKNSLCRSVQVLSLFLVCTRT
jgi:hypothetical protein